MAKGQEPPEFQKPDIRDIPFGGEMSAYAKSLMQSGLPSDLKDALIKRQQGNVGGMVRSGEQQLRENFAGSGGSAGSLLGGIVSLNANANNSMTDFYTNLGQQDFAARQQGFNNLSGLNNQLLSQADSENQFNLQSWGINEQNKFRIGQLIGQLGQLGGMYLPIPGYNKPKT